MGSFPIKGNVEVAQLRDDRDLIWAAAVELFKNNEPWWLTEAENTVSTDASEEFESSDPWFYPVGKLH